MVSERMATAIHEAGHVMACLKTNTKFDSVSVCKSVIDGSECVGSVQGVEEANAHTNIQIYYAGPIAEARYTQRTLTHIFNEGGSYDKVQIRNLLVMSNLTTRKTFRQWAQQIVDEEWEVIERIAEALVAKKTLKYKDVLKITRGR
jgi:hypothetical protein